jgi:hypothetical protein
MIPHIPSLLAAGDWIRLLFIFLFFVIPLLSKLLGGNNEAPAERRRVERRPVPPQPKPQPPVLGQPGDQPEAAAGGPGGGRNPLEEEIEAFLRRARGEKPRSKPAPQVKPQVAQEVRRLVEKPKSIKQRTPDAAPRRESVEEHVQRHITTRPISEHARDLGKKLGEVDEALEDRLHEVFDHKVGQLAKDEATQFVHEGTDAAVWETAESKRQKRTEAMGDRSDFILRMLSNPESIKQAIILGEVLKRPDFD